MKPKIYVLICCIVVCTIFFIAGKLLSKESFDSIPLIKDEDKGKYTLHRTEQVPREDVTSFIVDNGKIYIFYDETALINVYTIGGLFQYGIQIATIPNGHGHIAVQDGILFVQSRLPIIFIFQDEQLVDSIEPDNSYEKYISARAIFSSEKKTADDIYNYQLSVSNNDIIRQDTQKTVIDFPKKSYTAEHLLIAGLILLSLSLFGYEKLFPK